MKIMRNLLIISLLLIVQCSFGQARLKTIEEKKSSDGVSYKISSRTSFPNGKKMYSNASNKLDNELAVVPSEISRNAFASIDMGKQEADRRDSMIKKAFESKSRSIPQDTILVNYKMTIQGKILELNFWVGSRSQISVDDISLIEETLKKEYIIKLDTKQFKGMKYVWYTAPLYLSNLKD